MHVHKFNGPFGTNNLQNTNIGNEHNEVRAHLLFPPNYFRMAQSIGIQRNCW